MARAKIIKVEKGFGLSLTLTLDNNTLLHYDGEDYGKLKTNVAQLLNCNSLTIKNLEDLTFDWEQVGDLLIPVDYIPIENPILCDTREPEQIFKDLLPLSLRRTLSTGDYSFLGHINGQQRLIIIERKEAGNLLGSVLSSELSDQVNRMINDEVGAVLVLIEGFITSTVDGRVRTKTGTHSVTWAFLWNHLLTLQMENGIILDLSPNIYFTGLRIRQLYSYFRKTEHISNRQYRKTDLSSDATPGRRLLCGFDGIDLTLSGRILSQYTPIEFFNASKEDKMAIYGIGEKKVEVIERALNEVGKGKE